MVPPVVVDGRRRGERTDLIHVVVGSPCIRPDVATLRGKPVPVDPQVVMAKLLEDGPMRPKQIEVPARPHALGHAESLIVGTADVAVARRSFPRFVPLLSGARCKSKPDLDRPLPGAATQLQLVAVHGPDQEVGVVVAPGEAGGGAETGAAAPQRLLVRAQRQLAIAAGVVGQIALPLVEVIERHRVLVRLERPGPIGAHAGASRRINTSVCSTRVSRRSARRSCPSPDSWDDGGRRSRPCTSTRSGQFGSRR